MTTYTINWLWSGVAAFLAVVMTLFMYNGRTKTKQRRFVYLLWTLLVSAIIYCAMANHQFLFTRADGVTVTFGRWALVHLLTHGALAAVVVSGISMNTHVIKIGFVMITASALADMAGSFAPSRNGGNDNKALIACAAIAWVLTTIFALIFSIMPFIGPFIFGKTADDEASGRKRVQSIFWYILSVWLFWLARVIFTLFMFIGPEGRREYSSETLQIWLCGAAQIITIMGCMALMILLDPSGDTAVSGLFARIGESAKKRVTTVKEKAKSIVQKATDAEDEL